MSLRQNIRNFLLPMTPAEIYRELQISEERRDSERCKYIAEYLQEETGKPLAVFEIERHTGLKSEKRAAGDWAFFSPNGVELFRADILPNGLAVEGGTEFMVDCELQGPIETFWRGL